MGIRIVGSDRENAAVHHLRFAESAAPVPLDRGRHRIGYADQALRHVPTDLPTRADRLVPENPRHSGPNSQPSRRLYSSKGVGGTSVPVPVAKFVEMTQAAAMAMSGESSGQTSVPEALARGLAHHQSGRLADAHAAYQQALAVEPDNPDALHLAGMLARDAGHSEVAVRLIGAAIARSDHRYEFHNNLGNALRDVGRFDDAFASFRRALEIRPDDPAVLTNFAAALAAAPGASSAVLGEARDLAERAVHLAPNAADGHFTLGTIRLRLGERKAALRSFETAAQLAPDFAEAHYNAGVQYLELGETDRAFVAFARAIELKPGYVEPRCNQATVLIGRGEAARAVAMTTEATRLAPDHSGAHCVLGNALFACGQTGAAIAAYEQACRLDPMSREARFNLANALQDVGDTPSALAHYWRVLTAAPEFFEGWKGLGLSYRDQGRAAEALGTFARAQQLRDDPGLSVLAALMVPRIPASDEAISAARAQVLAALDRIEARDFRLHDAHGQVGAANFYLAYQARDDRALNERIARFYRQACPSLNEVAPHCRSWQPVRNRRIRVGFISELLRFHTIGKLTHGM
ncbi:MAG: tetratricopeptide repeat protein, partial [Alphaproteobacteria bacterium]|nr:tetratricopeptide repeat protein [Alphaproteobacteria bacterium]